MARAQTRILPTLLHDGARARRIFAKLSSHVPRALATLILSAGLGTRLAPVSSWRAKPLVPIGDRPAIAHILDRVREHSRVVVVNAHHRADEVASYARGAGLEVSREADLLGTAGGLARAADWLGSGDVLVWNGDMIGEVDVEALLAAHEREVARGALATLVVLPRVDGAGNTGLDARADVVRLRRESARPEVATADFLGIYVVTETLRRGLPSRGDIIAESFLPAIRRGARLATFTCESELIDVGTPRSYLRANLRWLDRRAATSWAGEGADIAATATLRGVVVGAGARVMGNGELAGCVVWPGAVATAPLTNAIVAPEGVVHIPR
jgi:mannose-1-phosphate guanylyltransferase